MFGELFTVDSDFLEINTTSNDIYIIMGNRKNIFTEHAYKGCMICSGLPKQLDNDLFTLIGLVGGFDSSDIISFSKKANNREKELLQTMVDRLELRTVKFDRSRIANNPTYKAMIIFINVIGQEGGVNSLNESTSPFMDRYITPKMKKILFKRWDKIGKADYDQLKFIGIKDEEYTFDYTDFRNVGDVVYPLLVIEWSGGVENTEFAKAPWQETSEMGFEKLKFKVEPIRFDYLFDESTDFGEHGYACWDIRVLIDKDGDLGLPINPEFIANDYTPFIQDLFPESARNKLSSFRNYTEDQFELIEGLWSYYHEEASNLSSQFCRVEVVLV